ncbi:MAG: HD domain-containing protein, partial [Anaerolineae bacterium]
VCLWLVGGAVRDLLLGRPVHDWDFAVDRDAMTLAKAVGDVLDGFYFPLDEERGTARVLLEKDRNERTELDFALLRGHSLKADLSARDFTINAMAVDDTRELFDPLGGQADLRGSLIRATQPHAFTDDPVRLVRAPRLEAELGFEIETHTEAWIRQAASLVVHPAMERLRDEFVRGLAISRTSRFVSRLDDLRLLVHIVPEVEELKAVSQSHPHRFDVWQHTLRVLETVGHVVATVTERTEWADAGAPTAVPSAAWGELERRIGQFGGPIASRLAARVCDHRDRLLMLKLGALLHDIGKPQTRSSDSEDRIHFYGHESVGAAKAGSRMRALRFSRDEVSRVRTLVEAHLRPAHLARGERVTRRAMYRYFRATDDVGVETVLLSLADHLATWGPSLREERWARRLNVAELLLYHYFEEPEQLVNPELPVDGHDLMRVLELEPGPEIGRLLDLLREAVAAGEVSTQQEALDLARRCAR